MSRGFRPHQLLDAAIDNPFALSLPLLDGSFDFGQLPPQTLDLGPLHGLPSIEGAGDCITQANLLIRTIVTKITHDLDATVIIPDFPFNRQFARGSFPT